MLPARLFAFAALLTIPIPAFAQETEPSEKNNRPSGPTEITSTKSASFNQKTREAVFEGDVQVKDPQFSLKADKLTAILKDAEKAPAQPVATGTAPNGAKQAGPSGLEKAIAEGKVVIFAERPGEDPSETARYVARSEKAIFDARTGDMTLIGWPQVQQGINTHIATEKGTVMIINQAGKLLTNGRSKTVIQDKAETPKNER